MRLFNAIKIGMMAFMHPQMLQQSNFKLLVDLFMLIMKCATEKRHMMTRLAYVHPEAGTENEIVSIWAGAGMTSDPTRRISELLEENAKLKAELSAMITNRND